MLLTFRSRRALLRRLARRALPPGDETAAALLRGLALPQLEALAAAVESRGADRAPCVLASCALRPNLLLCRMFRWPELTNPQDLRPLPQCRSPPRDPLRLCCNPFHWARIYKPETPPPPYCKNSRGAQKVEETEPSEVLTPDLRFTSHNSGSDSFGPWCKIAYWELSTRVGRLLPVNRPDVDIFSDLPRGDGLCLGTLARAQAPADSSVRQTRAKIGQGITLFREAGAVWVYNRSEHPVFLNSPALDPQGTQQLTVHRLPPGHAALVFDLDTAGAYQRASTPDGPFDPHSIRLSFAKGWGAPRYSRRFVTSCPCWLEIMFLVNR